MRGLRAPRWLHVSLLEPSVASSRLATPQTRAASSSQAAGLAVLRGPSLLAVSPAAVRGIRAVQGGVHLLRVHRVSNVCLPDPFGVEPLFGGEEPEGSTRGPRAKGLSQHPLQPRGRLVVVKDSGVRGCCTLDRASVLDTAATGCARPLAAHCGRRCQEGPLVQVGPQPVQSPFTAILEPESPGDVVGKLRLGAQGALVCRLQCRAQHLALALLQPLQVAGLSLSGRLILKADVRQGGAPFWTLPTAGLPAGRVARAPVPEVVSAGQGHPPVQGWASPAVSDGRQERGHRQEVERRAPWGTLWKLQP